MFVGHAAVALAAKKTAPEVSLGLLLAAAVWLDLVWPIFLLTGTERVRIDPGNTVFTPLDFTYYPWTHSLVMALAWSAAVAFVSGADGPAPAITTSAGRVSLQPLGPRLDCASTRFAIVAGRLAEAGIGVVELCPRNDSC